MLPLTPYDNDLLRNFRLARFFQIAPTYLALCILQLSQDTLAIVTQNQETISAITNDIQQVIETSYIVFGVTKIQIYCSQEQIGDYTYKNKVSASHQNMVAVLENPAVSNNVATPTESFDYISWEQLTSLAIEISPDNDFLNWMENSESALQVRIVGGMPKYATKNIVKAAAEWNSNKMQAVFERYLGQPPSMKQNGIVRTTSDDLKVLRTPSGFKPTKGGKDKFAKTISDLALSCSDRWAQYRSHILAQDKPGEAFLGRLAKHFSEKDAYLKLLEAVETMDVAHAAS